MELKDVILSTLAEIEELSTHSEPSTNFEVFKEKTEISQEPVIHTVPTEVETIHTIRDDEARMLEGIRERLLVLFEGFQSPNNVQIEAKVDLTLNFLEYLLGTIDNRLDMIRIEK
ncbi:MAG: hypothetical protein PHU29_04035 [Sulfuricurvum sp.]|uniref:CiaD-like domain-containing protein n=1 Tax=Sulfuricurvum sp. TaxID=2025608 RepID=UPI002620C466|nr:hypothetical protein [Sulfuricurvum sp.]MDD2949935.1 hypothetical protein [Sulfuricurvum sp.]MDD5119654.1 hypothetical protein [Sulfuricurvum sp.]